MWRPERPPQSAFKGAFSPGSEGRSRNTAIYPMTRPSPPVSVEPPLKMDARKRRFPLGRPAKGPRDLAKRRAWGRHAAASAA